MAVDDDLASRLSALEGEVARLRHRVAGLEAEARGPVRAFDEPATGGRVPPAPPAPAPIEGHGPRQALVPVVGTVLLALAGAYLVRALTDDGQLSPTTGVAVALTYAAAFLPAAWRAAGMGRRLTATAHAVTAALIAYPLLWETTVRFRVLPPRAALAILTAFGVLGLLVSARHALSLASWSHAAAAALSALGLLIATRDMAPALVALLVLAGLVEGLAGNQATRGLRWVAAGALDLGVVALALVAGRPQGLPDGYAPISPALGATLALSLPVLYLSSLARGTLRSRRLLTAPEMLQLAASLGLGFEGARRVLAAGSASTLPVATAACGLGLLGYGIAFAFVERRQGHGLNFYAYSSGAAFLMFLGTLPLASDVVRVAAWAALAVACAILAEWFGRTTLRYHALAFLAAAGLVSGLAALLASEALAASRRPMTPLTILAWAAFALTSVVLARGNTGAARSAVPRGLAALPAVFALPVFLGIAIADTLHAGPDLVLGLRSGLLAVLAVALAALARPALPELRWLNYAALAAGAIKLAAVDLPSGRSSVLFGSFLLLGGALVLSSRLMADRQ